MPEYRVSDLVMNQYMDVDDLDDVFYAIEYFAPTETLSDPQLRALAELSNSIEFDLAYDSPVQSELLGIRVDKLSDSV